MASADELRLEAKTTSENAPRLVELIRDMHSYEVPEILVTSVEGGDADYLAWIATETTGDAGGTGPGQIHEDGMRDE